MIKVQLPIPFDGYSEATIKKAPPSVLSKTREELHGGGIKKYLYALMEFSKGVLVRVNDSEPSYDIVKKMPLRNIEYISMIGMSLSSIDDKIAIKAYCESCGHITEYSNTKREDNRVSINDIPVNFSNEENPVVRIVPLTVSEAQKFYKKLGVESEESYKERIKILTDSIKTIKRKIRSGRENEQHEIFSVKSMDFRHPTLLDCIKSASKTNISDYEYLTNLHRNLLVGMTYEYDGSDEITDWNDAFSKFQHDGLFDFESEIYTERIQRRFFDYGIYPFAHVECEKCSDEFYQAWMFHSFFVYAHLLNGKEKE